MEVPPNGWFIMGGYWVYPHLWTPPYVSTVMFKDSPAIFAGNHPLRPNFTRGFNHSPAWLPLDDWWFELRRWEDQLANTLGLRAVAAIYLRLGDD